MTDLQATRRGAFERRTGETFATTVERFIRTLPYCVSLAREARALAASSAPS